MERSLRWIHQNHVRHTKNIILCAWIIKTINFLLPKQKTDEDHNNFNEMAFRLRVILTNMGLSLREQACTEFLPCL